MGDQGKYHRQWLKAREVLRLYAAGERDFRGTILRGCNFRRADLSRADLSRADLSRAVLNGAVLIDANFSGANLSDANLSGAVLIEANIVGSVGISKGQLYSAKLCEVVLPTGIDLDPDHDCEELKQVYPGSFE